MTMTTAVPSSEASSSSHAKRGLRGPRPQPLKVSSSSRGSSPASSTKAPSSSKKPVIVYEHTPKVIHARPQEFMTVVQRLTGKQPAPAASSSSSPYATSFSPATTAEEGGDPLLLTLGHRQAAPPAAPTTMPSPMTAGLLMSPGFIFSPNTMQAFQELSPMF